MPAGCSKASIKSASRRDGQSAAIGALEVKTNANFVGVSIGIVPGLAPDKILHSYLAGRRGARSSEIAHFAIRPSLKWS